MSKLKGGFAGFYGAGVRNACKVAGEEIDRLAAEFSRHPGGGGDVAAFAQQLKRVLAAEGVEGKVPPYKFTATPGYF